MFHTFQGYGLGLKGFGVQRTWALVFRYKGPRIGAAGCWCCDFRAPGYQLFGSRASELDGLRPPGLCSIVVRAVTDGWKDFGIVPGTYFKNSLEITGTRRDS